MTATAVAEKQEAVTFYSWMGIAGRAGEEHFCPSSQIVLISGGTKRLASDGSAVSVPVKEARFHNGTLTTDDPETIQSLRNLAARPGSCITENREEFYAATMTPNQKAKHAAVLGEQKDEQNRVLAEENKRLRQMLEQKASEEPAARRRAV